MISPAICATSYNSVAMEKDEASGESRTRPRRSVKPIQRYSPTFKTEGQIKKEMECSMTADERNKKQIKTGWWN
ncbi:hypothetical protein DdX_19492 [Ditylenchus destructor]|uniref:Uncharacterized protein n=1 Tax=Ditylenchus destructor TaxID=166010 RepID=A0AAD4QXC8_9BILA|nr:hypothetical protein DdX_19492 [Ditylenchus destructor]